MAAAVPLKFLTIPAVSKHSATMIFLHGLGDTGHGWQPVAHLFQADPALAHVKWILPHAPTQKVTANFDMEMPSWFDIPSFEFDAGEDETGMLQSMRLINQLISAEVEAGLNPSRIVLGGFSQGGTMSLLTGLTGERKLGGIAVLSGWLPLKQKFKAMASPHILSTPIFWGCGTNDPLVKFNLSKLSSDFLTSSLGIPLSTSPNEPKGLMFNAYQGMDHTAGEGELKDLKEWIKNVIPNGGPAAS